MNGRVRGTMLAGFAASFAMDVVEFAFAKATERTRVPDDLDEETEAIAYVVKRIGKLLPGTYLEDHPDVGGRIVHYVFGAGFAYAYAEVQRRKPVIGAAKGLAFGIGLWFLSDVVLIPAAHIGRSWFRYSRIDRLNAFLAHVAFGMTLETMRAQFDYKG